MNRRMIQQTNNRNLDVQLNDAPNNIYLSSIDMVQAKPNYSLTNNSREEVHIPAGQINTISHSSGLNNV